MRQSGWAFCGSRGRRGRRAGEARSPWSALSRPADPAEGHFTLFHLKDGVLIAADCVNDAHGFMAAKMMIAQRARPDVDDLVNPDVPMKDVMKAALAK